MLWGSSESLCAVQKFSVTHITSEVMFGDNLRPKSGDRSPGNILRALLPGIELVDLCVGETNASTTFSHTLQLVSMRRGLVSGLSTVREHFLSTGNSMRIVRALLFKVELFFLCCVFLKLVLFLLFVVGVEGCETFPLLGEIVRAVCGNYKSPELGLNLSGS